MQKHRIMRTIIFCPQFVLVVLLFAGWHQGRADTIVAPHGPTSEGVDVFSLQGSVDWPTVSGAGITFAFARVSNGLTPDSTFQPNYQGIHAAGLVRGAYQFFRPSQDPIAQANLVLSQIGTLGVGDMPPALDAELTDGLSGAQVDAAVGQWVGVVRTAIGRNPLIYTSSSFWDLNTGSGNTFSTDLWIASYSTLPKIPSAWTDWKFWQYTASGSVPGIAGAVDRDRFNGSSADLLAYATPEPSSVVLAAFGFVGLAAWGWRRRKR